MPLAAGTRLGPYEILGPLGAGGMGEVYRARDTRLDRFVAVKVLPSGTAPTPELRARFEREARAASALNHPHICVIHDVGQQDGTEYLVMELLEGETLAQRLDRGPLPPADVLRFGVEIADALDRAHRNGIVHRDLKPGNIMVTKSGAKLMDFGLARSTGLAASVSGLTQSPTVTRPLTAEGTIVGTFQYMAPEQLEGKDADARTDLFALGAVLYEMATGHKAFEGKSQASLISAIMSSQPPPIATLSPLSPPALDQVVRECLAKDPDERLQSAHDVKLQLQWIRESGSHAGASPVAVTRRGGRAAFVAAAVAALVAALGIAIPWLGSRAPTPGHIQLSVIAPEGASINNDRAMSSLSPDGRWLAFVAIESTGTQRLWLRPLQSTSARPMEGTDNAACPFWSPDSRFIGFFAEGKLRKIAIAGGAPENLCVALDGRGATWNRDGIILLAPDATGPLLRVSAEGGEPSIAMRPDSAHGETGMRFPQFLPDGRHFLFTSLPGRGTGFDIFVGTLGSSERKHLMVADALPAYAAPGYLIVERRGKLLAQRFDARSLELRGEPRVLGDAPTSSNFTSAPAVSVSATGVMAHPSVALSNTQLQWLDRQGRPQGIVPLPRGRYVTVSISPDSKRLMVGMEAAPNLVDQWMVDLEHPIPTRFTFGSGTFTQFAMWSPDGSRIAFDSNRDVPNDIYVKPSDGSEEEKRLLPSGPPFRNLDQWTFDGKYLIYDQPDAKTGWDVWAVPMQGEPKPFLCLHSRFNEHNGNVSPDGRWIGYISDESGRAEAYVTSFPTPGRRVQLSNVGASVLAWSSTGREILLIGLDGNLYRIDVQTTPTFHGESPRLAYRGRSDVISGTATPDLSRTLIILPDPAAAPPTLTVEMNWTAALKQ